MNLIQEAQTVAKRVIWTAEKVRELGLVTSLETAAQILGIGRSKAYEMVRTGDFPRPSHASRARVPGAGQRRPEISGSRVENDAASRGRSETRRRRFCRPWRRTESRQRSAVRRPSRQRVISTRRCGYR